jgi:hypothetical protein
MVWVWRDAVVLGSVDRKLKESDVTIAEENDLLAVAGKVVPTLQGTMSRSDFTANSSRLE